MMSEAPAMKLDHRGPPIVTPGKSLKNDLPMMTCQQPFLLVISYRRGISLGTPGLGMAVPISAQGISGQCSWGLETTILTHTHTHAHTL